MNTLDSDRSMCRRISSSSIMRAAIMVTERCRLATACQRFALTRQTLLIAGPGLRSAGDARTRMMLGGAR
jgi:hypothetical protein